ncbi:MAG: tRNA 2-thiouridine(34) synthase MnmA [bacterium]
MQKITCLMSGGVDSSVSAMLLKKQGYDVEGVFLMLNKNFNPRFAQAVAKRLNIKFRILDLKQEFKKQIIDYFVSEYKKGRTPNPCVRCNQFIKFNLPGLLATGHYAIIKNNKLYRGKDKTRDQSYFLYNLTKKQLKNILFPVGGYTKKQVREIAQDLPCNQQESRDICFLQGNHNEFLKRHLKLEPGPIKFQNKIIGQHQGLPLYTIGQRAGLGGGLFFVKKLDAKNNILYVTDKDQDLYSSKLEVENIHWIDKPVKRCLAQIRYGHPAEQCAIKNNKVLFEKPQRAITPGQSIVFYDREEVLGGGIIK